MEIDQHTLLYIIVVLCQCLHHVISEPRLHLSAPVNPVDESGILSIHCHVWDLQKGHEVTLIRILSEGSERLSVNSDVLSSVEDRVFVASRQLPDGSVVYFLSIIDVTKEDTGEYICKVLATSGTSDELPSESIFIESTYFPAESDPVCTPNAPLIVKEGGKWTFNCSSEAAYPIVSLGWERNGVARNSLEYTQYVNKNRVFSTLTLSISAMDNKAVFICKITSRAFPGRTRTCHVGPLTVQSDPNHHQQNTIPISNNDDITKPTLSSRTNPKDNNPRGDGGKDSTDFFGMEEVPEECRGICSSSASSSTTVFFWVLATVVTATIALIFFVVCVTMLFKYNSMHDKDHRPYLPGQLTAEEIYSEVEQKRENRLYMALDKGDCNPTMMECHNYIATNARRL